MHWLTALLTALAVLQAGVGVCSSPAHEAPAMDAVTVSGAIKHAETICHETGSAIAGHGAHLAGTATDAPGIHGDAAGMECCTSGACADCALVIGALVSSDAATPAMAPTIKAARAPSAPLGRPLSHDPPPPRA